MQLDSDAQAVIDQLTDSVSQNFNIAAEDVR